MHQHQKFIAGRGPYLNRKESARYCGYSYHYFRQLLVNYRIPSYGIKRKYYSVNDLDDFMNNPEYYCNNGQRAGYERKPLELKV